MGAVVSRPDLPDQDGATGSCVQGTVCNLQGLLAAQQHPSGLQQGAMLDAPQSGYPWPFISSASLTLQGLGVPREGPAARALRPGYP